MNGYQISFFTVQGYRHKGKPIGEAPADCGVLGQANAGPSASV